MRTFFGKYFIYIAATLGIWGPLLAPGYILTLDLVVTPDIRAPFGVGNDYLWQNLLHYLNYFIPSQLLEKGILVSIPLLASIGMHRLLERIKPAEDQSFAWYWAVYAASLFYAINPFTYDRFMAGQYAVLLGYALLPWFTRAMLNFTDEPDRYTMGRLVITALIVSIISIHTLGELLVIALVMGSLSLWQRRHQANVRRRLLKYGAWGAGIFVVLSSYWLVPWLFGKGNIADTISQFTPADTATFMTSGASKLGQLINVLRLQGFWAERHNLFLLPQDQLAGWGTVRLGVWLLVIWGAVIAYKTRRGLTAAWIAIGLLALVLASGTPQGLLTAIGYREPQKFAGLLAMIFAIFTAYSMGRLLYFAQRRSSTIYMIVACGALLLTVVFTPTMFGGFSGQLAPREYPADWALANARLNQDRSSFKVLFLPWHEYMSFQFAGRIIGNPAGSYFDKPVLISNDPELGTISQPHDNQAKTAIGRLMAQPPSGHLGAQLARYGIKYVLLAQDYDYQKYSYLDTQADLTVVWKSSSLRLYRNTAFKENN